MVMHRSNVPAGCELKGISFRHILHLPSQWQLRSMHLLLSLRTLQYVLEEFLEAVPWDQTVDKP